MSDMQFPIPMEGSESFSRFLALCFEKPEGEMPNDIEYNRLSRRAREDIWRVSEYRERFLRISNQFVTEAFLYGREIGNHNMMLADHVQGSVSKLWIQAVADLIRTPAADQRSVLRKKQITATRVFKHGWYPISADEAQRCIAADEAFLKAHPVRRTKPRTLLTNSRSDGE